MKFMKKDPWKLDTHLDVGAMIGSLERKGRVTAAVAASLSMGCEHAGLRPSSCASIKGWKCKWCALYFQSSVYADKSMMNLPNLII